MDGDALLGYSACTDPLPKTKPCPASQPMGRVGLIWVGEKFYPTPADFSREAAEMGISRRLPTLPKGFKLGETWVFLAHRKAVYLGYSGLFSEFNGVDKHFYSACIFSIFKPTAVEYVVRGDETPERLQKLIDRGITPVKVLPAGKSFHRDFDKRGLEMEADIR